MVDSVELAPQRPERPSLLCITANVRGQALHGTVPRYIGPMENREPCHAIAVPLLSHLSKSSRPKGAMSLQITDRRRESNE